MLHDIECNVFFCFVFLRIYGRKEKYVWAYLQGMLVKMSKEKTIVRFFF